MGSEDEPGAAEVSSHLDVFVHTPGIVLEGLDEFPLLVGRLDRISYDDWRALDDWLPGERRERFEHAQPVFYRFDLDTAAGPFVGEQVRDAVRPLVDRVVTALLLTSAVALPDPLLSMVYVRHPSSGAVSALVGPAGRNLVLGGAPRVLVLTDDMAPLVNHVFAIVERSALALEEPHLRQAIDALRRAGLPEYRPIDGLVHTTVALEGLVASTRASGVTKMFVDRSAMLIASDREDVDTFMSVLAQIYDIRSQALHGQHYPGLSDTDLQRLSDTSREFVARAVLNALGFLSTEPHPRSGLAALRRLLGRAPRDEAAWTELRSRSALSPADAGESEAEA